MKRGTIRAAIMALTLSSAAHVAYAQDAVKGTAKGKNQETASQATEKQIDPNQIVARVGNQAIRLIDVMEKIRALPPQYQQAPLEQLYPFILESMVHRLAAVKKARELGLDKSNEFKKMRQEVELDLLHRLYLSHDAKQSFTEDELKAEYNIYKKDFVMEDLIKTSHILVKDEKEAKDIIEKLKAGEDFAKLAEKSIDQASASKGGELGFLSKNDLIPEFTKAAFALKDGDFTQEPVKTPFGYHVIKRLATRQTEPLPYEKAKSGVIPNRLHMKETQARHKKALEDIKVDMYNMDGTPLTASERKEQAIQSEEKTAAAPEVPTSEENEEGAAAGNEAGKMLKIKKVKQ